MWYALCCENETLDQCRFGVSRAHKTVAGGVPKSHPSLAWLSGLYALTPPHAPGTHDATAQCAAQSDCDGIPSFTIAMSLSLPLSEYEKTVRDHALLASIAFLIIMPLGVLVPRYLRTFTNRWVPAALDLRIEQEWIHWRRWWWAHWIINFFISAPLVYASMAMALQASDITHFRTDDHKVRLPFFLTFQVYCWLNIYHFLTHRSSHSTPAKIELWLDYLYPVQRTVTAGLVHPLHPHPSPIRRSPTTAELSARHPRPNDPCNGRLPGSYHLSLLPLPLPLLKASCLILIVGKT